MKTHTGRDLVPRYMLQKALAERDTCREVAAKENAILLRQRDAARAEAEELRAQVADLKGYYHRTAAGEETP